MNKAREVFKVEKKIINGFVLKHFSTNYCVIILSIEGSHKAHVVRTRGACCV